MNPEDFATAPSPVTEALAEAAAPGFYEWAAPDGRLTVRLSYDVIDQMNFEVMRGFGAIPRRGAEVGGILIGRLEEAGRTFTVNGFRAVPCKHTRGPSYIMADEELATLEETLARIEAAPGRVDGPIGFFRSNTRDLLELAEEDQDLLERFFPAEPGICLMVRPFATRVSEATIFWRSDGTWASGGAESVFPFRRSELGGGKRPRRQRQSPDTFAPTQEESPNSYALETPYLPRPRHQPPPMVRPAAAFDARSIPIPNVPVFAESQPSKLRGTWVWIPLSFIFLLLGIVLGFQIALSVSRSQKAAEQQADPYALDLKVLEFGESLHLKWDGNLPAFKEAQSGLLHIRDGNNSKTVEITRDDIARGGIIYRNATHEVHFRLEIPQKERSSVSESIEVHVSAPSPAQR